MFEPPSRRRVFSYLVKQTHPRRQLNGIYTKLTAFMVQLPARDASLATLFSSLLADAGESRWARRRVDANIFMAYLRAPTPSGIAGVVGGLHAGVFYL